MSSRQSAARIEQRERGRSRLRGATRLTALAGSGLAVVFGAVLAGHAATSQGATQSPTQKTAPPATAPPTTTDRAPSRAVHNPKPSEPSPTHSAPATPLQPPTQAPLAGTGTGTHASTGGS
ncbi:MAG: hypothetical protein ACRDRL_00635 [Sciscionella sp.]